MLYENNILQIETQKKKEEDEMIEYAHINHKDKWLVYLFIYSHYMKSGKIFFKQHIQQSLSVKCLKP